MACSVNSEMYRLSTFAKWTSEMNPLRLARFGFLYSGKDDEVICFECKTHLDRWNANDNPREKHRRIAPDCPFLNGGATGNIAMEINPSDGIYATSETTTDNAELEADRKAPQGNCLIEVLHSASNRARKRGVFSSESDLQPDRPLPDFDKLRHEEERLRTFYDWPQWPASAQANPEALARAGLFYTGSEDRVQCAFCRGFIEKWEPIQLPEAEHKQHYPDCLFVRGEDVGNVPVAEVFAGAAAGAAADIRIATGNEAQMENAFALPDIQSTSKPTPSQLPTATNNVEQKGKKGFVDDFTIRPNEQVGRHQYQHEAVITKKFKIGGDNTLDVGSLLNESKPKKASAQTESDASGFTQNPSTSELGNKVTCDLCGNMMEDFQPQDDTLEDDKKRCPRCLKYQ